ncbi:MAG: serpin family protein [Gemmatimonadaceae bacterium]|nr:serpin family protein [Gemmatimonadaceae bacterium]
MRPFEAPKACDLRRLAGRMVAAAATLTATACGEPTAPGSKPPIITTLPRSLSTAETSIATSTSTFGLNLLREVNGEFPDSNVFLSPLSASMALGLSLNGASGATFDEMRGALALPDQSLANLNAGYKSLITLLRGLDATVDMRLANSVWYRTSFGPQIAPIFLSDAQTFFDARVAGLDFSAAQAPTTINEWVAEQTNNKITRIVDQIPSQTVMYVINAVYFKGAWRDGFDARKTASAEFTTRNGSRVPVQMMTRKGNVRARTTSGVDVLELPYGGDAFVMTIVAPPATQSIDSFINTLTPAAWDGLLTGLATVDWDVYVPKFTLEFEDTLKDDLQALGMRQAFVEGGADFTRLSPTLGRDIFISQVKQKTFVDVNEVGTEAAAVTSVEFGVTSLPPSIRINRPFVFAIRERLSGTILFMGKIIHPKTR